MKTSQLLLDILAEKSLDAVAPTEATAIEDLGLDSLDLINFFFAVEEAMKVKIPDSILADGEIVTIADLARFVDANRPRE